ncbi:Acetyltransferase (GNAT) family protein [Sinosporangium album]|uniref:Acetyltransferase (GNAT) family protein n=1 Tax=Sinosporangium album TaxID=504805 RepID=A0A1G8B3U3_9ACTN|nr:GNAT family N-acetyltransferase [Sinosporangium album]SDH27795.1 Acetyltransferase (GNAT) family protein [Sinosporangium album]
MRRDAMPADPGDHDQASEDAARRAVRVLTAAFSKDDLIRWLMPSTSSRLFESVVAESAAVGGLDVLDEVAAAVWLPWPADDPQAEPPTHLPFRLRKYVELTAPRHPSGRDHLYLQFLGVHPDSQGLGIGSSLLARGLTRADDAGLPVFLEAGSPQNVRLYERHAFEPLGDPIVFPDGPTIWPMLREPRRRA